jgi:GrpB-like predicted nucleotidyltransferase (UPF0157 family)
MDESALHPSIVRSRLRYPSSMARTTDESIGRDRAGLCCDCLHARRVESVRSSVFFLCELSLSDPRFPRYPRLPILSCSGYAREKIRRPDPITVVDYDPHWPALFESLRVEVAGALGDLAQTIEHVGSTAVPGLAAKPIIDIDVLLRSASDLSVCIERLAALGYEHRGDLGIPEREAFAAAPGRPAHHLYVCPHESREFRRHVAVRDYLRTHPSDASSYGELKRSLAVRYRDERSAYNDGKKEFIESLLRIAAPGLLFLL